MNKQTLHEGFDQLNALARDKYPQSFQDVARVNLRVYRRLDNRLEGLSDNSSRAHELHDRRKTALHEVLDRETNVKVTDWGLTDDFKAHESVEIMLEAVASAFTIAVEPGLRYVAVILAEKAVDAACAEIAKWLIAKLRPKQESKEILDFQINLPDGNSIQVYPQDEDAEITIRLKNGRTVAVHYNATPEGVNHRVENNA